jgi:23S rRNA (cytosine1962-C5)-methyltransferase
MKFLRLPDPLLSVLFEDEDIIAIDKPYGFNAHTNDSKIEHSQYIQDGLIEIYEKQLGRKLHIIHRLDQTTTGVMIFGKSVESAKKYAEFFFNRQVKKTYWFITKSKSKAKNFLINKTIVHKAKDLDAETDLVFLKSSPHFELWQANPHTGRNHQIRIHAEEAGIPILGDAKYNGATYAFLCLHNHRIEFPNGVVILSEPPVYFKNLNYLEDAGLARLFFEADRRLRLFSSAEANQCYRLVHAKNNSAHSNFTVDNFGANLVLNYKDTFTDSDANRFAIFAKHLKKPIVYKPQAVHWVAQENKMAYHIRTNSGQAVGLLLNQRLQRNWVLNNSKEKSVLNLYAYTSTYSLAAALGGAKEVISVEASKNSLNWGRENFELNKVNHENLKFLLRDSLTFIEQCHSKNNKFDLIICDAPSFMRREKGFFKIEDDIEALLGACLKCLNQNGQLLFSTNYDNFFIDDIRNIILKVQKSLKIEKLEISCILPALDFELPDEKTNLKSFLIQT